MLIGYVSDEYFVAVSNVSIEATCSTCSELYVTHSSASGAIELPITQGFYTFALSAEGFSPKRSSHEVLVAKTINFRLLSKTLYGYVSPRWSAAGTQAKVLVSSKTPYSLELWHYGAKKSLVRRLGFDTHPLGATLQTTPDGDYLSGSLNWDDSNSVTAPDESGLYFVHIKNLSGEEIVVPWIISPIKPIAKIAVLTSSSTWSAYNNFGGRSNYVLPTGLPTKPLLSRRLDLPRYSDLNAGAEHETWDNSDYPSLTFERPEPANTIGLNESLTDPISTRDANGLASAEWRLLGWMENQSLDYDLYSDVQLHFDEIDLASYSVLVMNCHPEYWSKKMYESVKDWVHNKGGKLIYLGGNGITCEVDYPSATAMSVKNGDYSQFFVDGKFRCFCEMPCNDQFKSRFTTTVEPEAHLLGISYDRDGLMTAAPYSVVDENHWIFENTGLKNGDLFGIESLHTRCPGGASGHEIDKIQSSSPANIHLLAKGTNPDNSGAEMTIYETSSGGAVFAVGSINYPSSLPVDKPLSEVTRNVFFHFLK